MPWGGLVRVAGWLILRPRNKEFTTYHRALVSDHGAVFSNVDHLNPHEEGNTAHRLTESATPLNPLNPLNE